MQITSHRSHLARPLACCSSRVLLPCWTLVLVAACGAPREAEPAVETPQARSEGPARSEVSRPDPAPEAPAAAPQALQLIESSTLVAVEVPGVRNVHAMNGLLFAGQPDPDGVQALYTLGVKSVLNSRTQPEMDKAGFDERAVVEGLGMSYVHLPWNGADQLSDDVLDRTREFLRDAPRPALYHCASANRVGAGWIAYRVLDEGVDFETALAEGRTIGLRTEDYVGKVRDYVARRAEAGR